MISPVSTTLVIAIAQFLEAERIAVVGASDKNSGGSIFKELKKRGREVYPVHPEHRKVADDHCYPSLTALAATLAEDGKHLGAAVVSVSPRASLKVVEEAASCGLTHLWFQHGADFTEALAAAQGKGITVISGRCVLMYSHPVTGIHQLHRMLDQLVDRMRGHHRCWG